jgi:hypothetical protein
MILSHIGVLLVCGTWLYVTAHKVEGVVMYAVAFVLWLLSVMAVRGGVP